MVVPTGFGKKGIPDHIFCCPVEVTQEMVGKTMGMFVAVEAKTDTGKATGIQKVRIAEIIKAGGVAHIVNGIEQLPSFGFALVDVFNIEV